MRRRAQVEEKSGGGKCAKMGGVAGVPVVLQMRVKKKECTACSVHCTRPTAHV